MKKSQDHRVVAVYQNATLSVYRDNPLIEALPPINSFLDDSSALKSSLRCTAEDIHRNGIERAHSICRVIVHRPSRIQPGRSTRVLDIGGRRAVPRPGT